MMIYIYIETIYNNNNTVILQLTALTVKNHLPQGVKIYYHTIPLFLIRIMASSFSKGCKMSF